MNLVTVSGLNINFGTTKILQNIDFAITAGEIVTIVGPNGSGKSTFLRSIIGAVNPTAGSVKLAPETRIGYVPQRLHVDSTLPITVQRFLNLPQKIDNDAAHRALEQSGAERLVARQLSSLSGGQFQKVLLARALLVQPNLLILDEPTQGLDQPGSAGFYRQLESIRADVGCAVLMVSHELHVVMAASDRVICLNGHVCCEGHPEHVATAPEYRALFGTGTQGALALYRHEHSHSHDHDSH